MNADLAVEDRLGERDIHWFREGTHSRLYRKLGCRLGKQGARFTVWAPSAEAVSVIGDFHGWRRDADRAQPRADGSGLWEADVAGVREGQAYKFAIRTRQGQWL